MQPIAIKTTIERICKTTYISNCKLMKNLAKINLNPGFNPICNFTYNKLEKKNVDQHPHHTVTYLLELGTCINHYIIRTAFQRSECNRKSSFPLLNDQTLLFWFVYHWYRIESEATSHLNIK